MKKMTSPRKIRKISLSFFKEIVFLLFIALLPTQLGKHFFFPFSYITGVRVDYLAPTLYLTDLVFLLLLVINCKKVFNAIKNKHVLFFFALLLVNVFFAESIEVAFYRFLKITELILTFFLFKEVYAKQNITHKLLSVLIPVTLVETILASLQFLYKHSLQGIFYFFGERYLSLSTPDIAKGSLQGVEVLRSYATFSHPNSMAGFYLLLYFFTLTFKSFNNYKVAKTLLLFFSTILIFLSFSKVAIIAFIILNLFFVLKKIRIKKACRICSLSQIMVYFVLASVVLSFKSDPLSVSKRLDLMSHAFALILSHPFTGVGLGNYVSAQAIFPIKYPYFFAQPVHNIFLLFLAETGFIISGFVLWQMIKFVKNNLKKEVFVFALLVVFLTGSFDHYWLTLQQNFLLLAVVFGLSTSS